MRKSIVISFLFTIPIFPLAQNKIDQTLEKITRRLVKETVLFLLNNPKTRTE
jgi:hypothetical protein